MESWKTRERRTILQRSRFLTVETHTIELPNGEIIEDWDWVVTPDYVNIAVMTIDGLFVCFRQTKYAVEGTSLAPVGGYLEPGEFPLDAAQRELLEETGYRAPEWMYLGRYAVDGNRGAGNAYLFLAKHARPIKEVLSDDLEEQQMVLLTCSEVQTR
jgi:ADP-ribose pyrophosphatase